MRDIMDALRAGRPVFGIDCEYRLSPDDDAGFALQTRKPGKEHFVDVPGKNYRRFIHDLIRGHIVTQDPPPDIMRLLAANRLVQDSGGGVYKLERGRGSNRYLVNSGAILTLREGYSDENGVTIKGWSELSGQEYRQFFHKVFAGGLRVVDDGDEYGEAEAAA